MKAPYRNSLVYVKLKIIKQIKKNRKVFHKKQSLNNLTFFTDSQNINVQLPQLGASNTSAKASFKEQKTGLFWFVQITDLHLSAQDGKERFTGLM